MSRGPIHYSRSRDLSGARVSSVGVPHGIDRPPTRGAPAAVYPIAISADQRALAPAPIVDRFPTIVGQHLSVSYLSSVSRMANTGYRQQYVDLLTELREQDPHLFSVLGKRVTSTANGRVELTRATLSKDDPDHDLAKEIAEDCQSKWDRIPNRTQALAWLLWATFYGLEASEIFWNRKSRRARKSVKQADVDWSIDRLEGVHSRRLSYPDGLSWDLRIWDQGQVLGWDAGWSQPTNSPMFGLRIANYPGKFIVHTPQLSGDYPTRDGLGRYCAIWAVFKRIGARGASAYLERFAKGFMDVTYSTADPQTKLPRPATDDDIALASRIAADIGAGAGSFGSHADSIQINPKSFDSGSGSKITWQEWIQLCDTQMSKAVLGGTLGTEVGKGGGNRALGEVQERGEVDLEQYDATALGESLKRDVFCWLVRLNYPGCEHLVPNVIVHVDTDPDPKTLIANAKSMAEIGAPVDLDDLSDKTGIVLVPNEEKDEQGKPKPRRAYLPDVTPPTEVDPELESEESKQAKQDQADADNDVAMQKAKQPAIAPDPLGGPAAGAGGKGAPQAASKATKKPAKKKTATKPSKKLRDETEEDEAAIAIVRDAEGRILTVSRPETSKEQAIPGGHVDPGENPVEAAIRELSEETGITVTELRFDQTVRSPIDGRAVHVFEVLAWSGEPAALEEGTKIEWLTYRALFDQALFFRPTLRELHKAGLFEVPVAAA